MSEANMNKIEQLIKQGRDIEAKATEGPWEKRNDAIDFECDVCGSEFPENGYGVESTDKHQSLNMRFYGMYSLCEPNMEFITHTRNQYRTLLDIIEKQHEALEKYPCDRTYMGVDSNESPLFKHNDNCLRCTTIKEIEEMTGASE